MARKPKKLKKPRHAEIFWDGGGWRWIPVETTAPIGPFTKLHAAWQSANKARYEVIDVRKTAGSVRKTW